MCGGLGGVMEAVARGAEIGFARALGRPVVALRSWTLKGEDPMESAPGPELAQGEDREGVRPGQRRGRGGKAGLDVDSLGEQAERGGGSAQVGHQAEGGSPLAERGKCPRRPGGRRRPGIFAAVPVLGGDDAETGSALGEQLA